jgi:hypothetical protein
MLAITILMMMKRMMKIKAAPSIVLVADSYLLPENQACLNPFMP